MNENYLAISGKCSIPESLEIDTEYAFTGIVTVEKIEKKGNGEGFDYTHKAKFTSHLELQKSGKAMKAEVKSKNSLAFRGAVWHLQQDEGIMHIDEERFYNAMTAIAIEHLHELYLKYYEK